MNIFYLNHLAADFDKSVTRLLCGAEEASKNWRQETVITQTLSPFPKRVTQYGQTHQRDKYFILALDESGLAALKIFSSKEQYDFHCQPVKYTRRDWHKFAYQPDRGERERQITALLTIWRHWLNTGINKAEEAIPGLELAHHTLGGVPLRASFLGSEILPPDAAVEESNDARPPDSSADTYEEKGWRAFLIFRNEGDPEEEKDRIFKIPLHYFSAQRLPIIPKKSLPRQCLLFAA